MFYELLVFTWLSFAPVCTLKDYMVVYLTGTEMRQIPLQDHSISTPEGLKRALEDPRSRQYYILDADVHIATMKSLATMAKTDQDGNVLLSPTGGRRRVDLILYRNVQDDTSHVSPLVGVHFWVIIKAMPMLWTFYFM